MKLSKYNPFKKIQYNSPVILTFTLISFIVLVIASFTKHDSTRLLFSVYRTSPSDVLLYLRLFTHVLGHVDFEHYFGNFLLILLIGPMLEEKYGSKKLVIMIIFTAFITGVLNIAFLDTALLGASGIVFMMILLSSYANYQEGKIPLTLILVIIAFLGREIYDGLLADDSVSQITHIIGGLVGGVLGYLLNNKKSKEKL